ncbi:MAG: hypothetical protein SCALA702_38540 [Melioribacteraceae bacterium]|nr:MAG: hypothetical protein SCALA702_38540 [Melioribacteraceae bacterium]
MIRNDTIYYGNVRALLFGYEGDMTYVYVISSLVKKYTFTGLKNNP